VDRPPKDEERTGEEADEESPKPDEDTNEVDEDSADSFPASDPPPY
jgi:hypothetical protein